MNKILCIVGLPGSGKTYLANEFRDELEATVIDDISKNNDTQRLKEAIKAQKSLIVITDPWLCKSQAKARNQEFAVDREYLANLFMEQDQKCAMSGVDLKIAATTASHMHGETTASLDRKDSSKGYVEGNVQWVHKDINRMKWDLTIEQFLNWSRLVTEFNNRK